MATRTFTKEVDCPAGCHPPTAEKCKFDVEITWNEVEDAGRIYASDFVFEMKPEQPTMTCEQANFGVGTGTFELTPKGASAFEVNNVNVWQQQQHAQNPALGSATGPGGTDVDYRDSNNNLVPDKSSGEPFRISYSAGLLEKIDVDVEHPVTCGCPAAMSPPTKLLVDFDFTSRRASTGGGGSGGGGSCFIATVVYGVESHQVAMLRRFRDNSMISNSTGRTLVRAYYLASPPVAWLLRHSPFLRRLTQFVLDRLLRGIIGDKDEPR